MPSKQSRLSKSLASQLKSVAEFDFGRSELLESGNFSDFTIVAQGVELKLHRACLAGSSEYFNGLINGGLSESITCRLELKEEHPCAVFLVVWYIYTRTYPKMEHGLQDWDSTLEATFLRAAPGDMAEYKSHLFLPHLEVFKLADMMLLPKLKEIAVNEMRNQLLEFPRQRVLDPPVQGARNMPWSRVADLKETIAQVHNSDGTVLFELRNFLAWACIYNTWKWGYGQDDFEELAIEFPAFAWDLYVERDLSTVHEVKTCRHCRKESKSSHNVLVLEPSGAFTVVTCRCQFRNFCMDGCLGLPEDGFADVVPLYCRKCSTGCRKQYDLLCVKRGAEGLESVTDGSGCRLYGQDRYCKVDRANV